MGNGIHGAVHELGVFEDASVIEDLLAGDAVSLDAVAMAVEDIDLIPLAVVEAEVLPSAALKLHARLSGTGVRRTCQGSRRWRCSR